MSNQSHPVKRFNPRSLLSRAVVFFLAFSVTVQPWVPAITYAMAQDMISYGNSQSNELWGEIQGSLAFPNTGGGTQLEWDGEGIPVNELFQAPKQDTSYADLRALSQQEFHQTGEDAIDSLHANEFTSEGQAFRALRESAYLSKPDLNQDPIWGSTDAVFGFLSGESIDCTAEDTHEPDYKTCERLNVNENACTIFHEISVIPSPTDIVFLVDNSGSMDGVIASLRGTITNLITILTQEDARDLRLGGAATRQSDYLSNHVALDQPGAFVTWVNSLRTTGGTTYSAHAGLWTLENYSWRTEPEVERLLVIIGNEDNPGGGESALLQKAAEMGVNIYVFHNNGNQKALGQDMGNGFSAAGMLDLLKELVKVEDSWGPVECIHTAITETNPYCSRSVTVSEGAQTDTQCLTIGGLQVCPGDAVWRKISESPIPGIPRMAQLVGVSELSCGPGGDESVCMNMEKNPACGFISSRCIDDTPEQMIRDLYEFGLNRTPESWEVMYWVNQLNSGKSYDNVRNDFFRSANFNDEGFINTFSCKTYEETYDCGHTETSNAGACAVQDLFTADFADCVENLVPNEVERTIETSKLFTCEDALLLTECTVEREITTIARQNDAYYSRGCFIEEEIDYLLPWAKDAVSGSISLNVTGQHTSAEVLIQPSVSNGWKGRIRLNGSGEKVEKTRNVPATCGSANAIKDPVTGSCYVVEEYEETVCPIGSSLSVTLRATGHSALMSEKEFAAEEGNAPCLRDTDDWTDTSWVCEQHSPLNINGVNLTEAALASALDPMYPGAAGTCVKGHATYDTKAYGEGELCWTGPDGKEFCENIDTPKSVAPGTNTCSGLEAQVATGECRFDGRFPIEDGNGSTGYQYVWEKRYTCVTDSKTVTKTEMEPEYVCEGIVRCMGTECMTPNRESSDSFGKAATMLQAVQEIGEDVTCDVTAMGELAQCRVFAGEAQTCKQALGGYVDCCDSPGGVSLGDYVTATKGALKMDAYIMGSESAGAMKSAYTTIRSPIAASVEYVYDAFTSVADNITGTVLGKETAKAGGAVAENALKTTINTAKQAMMRGANEAMTRAFGPDVAGMFFEQAGGQMALTSGFAAALSVIGLIYTIYTVAKLLVSIIWTCSEDELALAVDVDLKKTRYIGSYCAKKSVFGCTEKRKSYCVFSSPLARILNEQARPQLGRGWGTPKAPDCSGISLDDLGRLDWNQMDLGEWMDILNITGNMPGAGDLSIDGLTGSGSYLGQLAADGGDTRLNTIERNEARLDEVDLSELNNKAADDLWRRY